jgi:hypothetical protein
MAIYKLQPAVSRIAGSRKGITFQKAGTNFVIRNRTVIVQKRTPRQSFVKSLLATRAQVWRTLTAPQKASWLAQVGNYQRTDSLGNVYNIQANPLQIFTNVNAEILGNPPILSGSAPVSYPAYEYGQLGFAGGFDLIEAQIRDTLNPTDFTIPVGFDAKIYFTAALSSGQSQPPDYEYKLVSVLASGFDTENHNYYSDYLLQFPPLVAGSGLQFWSAFKLVSLVNYIDSDFVFSEGEVL